MGVVADSVRQASRLLYIRDRNSGLNFLIDTGASISVLPQSKYDKVADPDAVLYAANGSKIETYGEKLLTLNIGLQRTLSWPFVIAKVKYPILGADFLAHFNLSINLHDHSIIDNITEYSIPAHSRNIEPLAVAATNSGYHMEILNKYPNLTEYCDSLPEVKHNYKHHIPTNGSPPFVRPRKLNPNMLNIAKEAFSKMLSEGIVRVSSSSYASPLHMVPKKQGWRLVGDYRALNKITKRDTYPLPYLQDFSLSLYGKTVFSRLDLKDAFYQLPIAEEDIPKTCVTTPFGAFEFLRMNFGLSGAAQSFQRFVDSILRDIKVVNSDGTTRPVVIFAYIDDLLVASADDREHCEDLDALFKRLSEYNLRLNLLKCEFSMHNINFLGHKLSKTGLEPLPDKVSAIKEFPLPKTFKDLRRFVGMVNFYHRFIKDAAKILAPLNGMLSGYNNNSRNKTISWDNNKNARLAFDSAKDALASATLLQYPSLEGELSICTDASDVAVGGVLQQLRDDSWVPLGFFSRKLTKRENTLSTFSRELLAVYLSLKHFRHWVEGTKLTIYTDHKALIGAIAKPLDRAIAKESRQLSYISQYNPNIVYISGARNVVADALSRSGDEQVPIINACSYLSSAESKNLKDNQFDDELKQILDGSKPCSLNISLVNDLYCDVNFNNIRPYIPVTLRKRFFRLLHDMYHPGIKQSQKLIGERFVWPYMKKDIKEWASSCIECQTSKVHRHNRAVVESIPNEVPKFSTVHMDLVGPLPPNKGFTYLLTMMDRFTRWPEVVPLSDMRAETVADCFLFNWVSRYGIPDTLTTDRGSQFESALFNRLLSTLGCTHNRTTAYHPQSNGLIERFHKTLKQSLRSFPESEWLDKLPLILLGLRTAYKEELSCAPSNMMYGCSLKLPLDLIQSNEQLSNFNSNSYSDRLRIAMSKLSHPVSREVRTEGYIDKNLLTCKYVFVRNDGRKGLQPNYRGPFRVLERKNKYFVVQLDNKVDTISVDRLKAAHVDSDYEAIISDPTDSSSITIYECVPVPSQDDETEQDCCLQARDNTPDNIHDVPEQGIDNFSHMTKQRGRKVQFYLPTDRTTKSGRKVKPPKRFCQ